MRRLLPSFRRNKEPGGGEPRPYIFHVLRAKLLFYFNLCLLV